VAAVTARKTQRYVVMSLCVVVIVGLVGIVVRQSLAINSNSRHTVREEQEVREVRAAQGAPVVRVAQAVQAVREAQEAEAGAGPRCW